MQCRADARSTRSHFVTVERRGTRLAFPSNTLLLGESQGGRSDALVEEEPE
jgi:hypothetical protein